MHTSVSIPGIHCEGCAALIKDVSGDFPAITNTNVDLERKTVTLEHDESFNFDTWKAEVEGLNETYKVLPLS